MKKKYKKLICEYTKPRQNSSPTGMSLSGVIFNLVSSLTNDWTPPFVPHTKPQKNICLSFMLKIYA